MSGNNEQAKSNLMVVHAAIFNARLPEDVFGQVPDREAIRRQYLFLLKQVHPDLHQQNSDDRALAEEATLRINRLHLSAQRALADNNYGPSRRQDVQVCLEFSANGYHYRIFADPVAGDFSEVYFGERTKEGSSTGAEAICLKASTEQGLLENEAETLRVLQHRSLPVLLDTLDLSDRRRANVLSRISGSSDLLEVREHFPLGLSAQHVAWIMSRFLSVLGYLHIRSVLHGAVEPGNCLIVPDTHNGVLVDLVLAIRDAAKNGSKYAGYNEYSAPEIKKGAAPHPASDLYSLGKTMIYLLGGEEQLTKTVDPRFIRFLGSFTTTKPDARRSDAWQAWHELKQLRLELFGPARFLVLDLEAEDVPVTVAPVHLDLD